VAGGLLWLAAAVCPAQSIPESTPASTNRPARLKRGASWLHRPQKDTPAAQFAHADALRADGELRAASRAYEAVIYAWPDSDEAPRAQYAVAYLLETRGKYAKAFDEYQYLVDHYTGHFNHAAVVARQFAVANQVYRGSERRWLPGTTGDPRRALPMFERIAANGPAGEHAAEAQFNVAAIHEELGELEEAIVAFEAVQERFLDRELAATAAYRRATCLYSIAKRYPNDESAWQAARVALLEFRAANPGHASAGAAAEVARYASAHLAGLAFERGRFYERMVKRPEAARQAYEDVVRQFPETAAAEKARARLAAQEKESKPDEQP
jgi:outer membrane protein assembly factor BamD (BamD/ComL family)